ncbi:MAG: hypothetical protein ACI4W6_01015, partial [Acutalibacteraceae bacterium]
ANPYDSRLIFAVVMTDDVDFSERLRSARLKFDEFNRNIYLSAIDGIRLRKGISKEDALEYYTLLQDIHNGYLIGGKTAQSSFDSVFFNHEKSLEKTLDFILYGIAEKESEE